MPVPAQARALFGPDPMFSGAYDEELYQQFKPHVAPPTGHGGTVEAVGSLANSFLEGLSRGRAISRADADRDRSNKLNALRSEYDRISADPTLMKEDKSARLGELSAKINEIGTASIEHAAPQEPARGVLGHVGRFFSNAADRIAGHGGEKVDIGTVESPDGGARVPWMQDFQRRVADPTITRHVPTEAEVGQIYADAATQARQQAAADGRPNNWADYLPGNAKLMGVAGYLPQVLQAQFLRMPMSAPETRNEMRNENVSTALETPEEQRNTRQQGLVESATLQGRVLPKETVTLGSFNKDGTASFVRGSRQTGTGRLTLADGTPAAPDMLVAGDRGAPFGVQATPTSEGIARFNVMTGELGQTGAGVYSDPAMAAYHRAAAMRAGDEHLKDKLILWGNQMLAQAEGASYGDPALAVAELDRLARDPTVDEHKLAAIGYAKTLLANRMFTGARTGATEAGGALSGEKATTNALINSMLGPNAGKPPQPTTRQPARPVAGNPTSAYEQALGGKGAVPLQYSAPGVAVGANGVPVVAPAGGQSSAYEEFMKGLRRPGSKPLGAYEQMMSGAAPAAASPSSVYSQYLAR